MFSGEFPKFKSLWYTWRNFWRRTLSRWKMESRNVHTYYIYVKPLNEGFIIPLISFSSLLASIFWKVVWSHLSILPIKCTWKKKTTEIKETIYVFLMTRKKFLWALKFTAEKSCLKIGGKIKDHMHLFCPYFCPVLLCITKVYLACSIALTR